MNNGATIHAEHFALNKLKTRPRNKKLLKVSIIVIKVSNTGLISMSKPCKHCIDIMQRIANLKGYFIESVFFSNSNREIEEWTYSELENDPHMHITDYYKSLELKNFKKNK
jgi:cytidine deaminase